MRNLLVFMALLCNCPAIQAMDEKMERVNAIKKSCDYLYGDATMGTQEEAAALAFELLRKEINGWLLESGGNTSGNDFMTRADTLVLRRAAMYRVFAFVKKSELQSVPSATPVPDDGSSSSVPDTVPEESHRPQPNMRFSELVTQGPKTLIKRRFDIDNEAIRRVKRARNFFELRDILPPLKEEGLIADYGKYATAEKPEDCYLIVYDVAGNIKALLGKGETIRLNLKTGAEDSIANYRGCGAIWFALR